MRREARPKLRPLIPLGTFGVTQLAWAHVDDDGKLGLVCQNAKAPRVSRVCVTKRTGAFDLYHAVIRYLRPGVTDGVQKPMSRATRSLPSPSP